MDGQDLQDKYRGERNSNFYNVSVPILFILPILAKLSLAEIIQIMLVFWRHPTSATHSILTRAFKIRWGRL